MSAGDWIVVVVAVVATVATVAWFVGTRRHPEHAAGTEHGKPDPIARRPAGPAAETMSADRPGGRTPVEPSDGPLGPESGLNDPARPARPDGPGTP